MSLTENGFFYCSLPTFASLEVYKGVKKMVRAYPDSDEEVMKRRWLGHIYRSKKYPLLALKETGEGIGYGLFAGQAIAVNTVVGEYTGLVKKRSLFTTARKDYVGEYTIPGYPVKYIIDAEHYGSLMRYVNHSDQSNIYSITVIIDDILRVFFIAEKPLGEGEQLLLDYGPTYWRYRPTPVKISFT